MARSNNQKNYFSFTKGLITEASAINTVENSSADEDNMDLVRNGTRRRRRGIDIEKGGSAITPLSGVYVAGWFNTAAISVHEWRSVGGDGARNYSITQVGDILTMAGLDVATVSGAVLPLVDNTAIGGVVGNSRIVLSSAKSSTRLTHSDKVQISFGKGVAYVVSPSINPFYIEYHPTTATFSTHYIGGAAGKLQVRDFNGVDDLLAVDKRIAATTYAALVAANPKHAYNLLNQGWTPAHIRTYCTATGTAPSNSDVWWYGKNSTGVFTPAEMDKMWFGSMRGARGHYLHNAFTHIRSAIVAGTPNFTTTARPSCTTFYSGRVWYSGIADAQYSGAVLYSRLIEDPAKDAGACHMGADPTSEVVMDLIASDGGVITIPEAGKIVKLTPVQDGILVFAVNGVWHIRGARDTGFSATGFSVLKVTNVGTTSPDSIVEVEGGVMYWSRAGIYLVSINSSTFNMSGQNVTQGSIQKKVDAVDTTALPYVKGVYDPLEREVKWFYSEVLPTIPEACDKILTLDLVLKAWYAGSVSTAVGLPQIVAPFKTLNLSPTLPAYESMVRFITLKESIPNTFVVSIGCIYDNVLMDWRSQDTIGLPYTSFIETSYELFADAMRNKTLDDVHLFFNRTENTVTNGVLDQPSGCMMSYKFDWADDVGSGKWTRPEQAYKFTRGLTIPSGVGTFPFVYGQSVISTKHNIRGSGRSMQLRLESEGSKDMHVLGWSVFVSGNSR